MLDTAIRLFRDDFEIVGGGSTGNLPSESVPGRQTDRVLLWLRSYLSSLYSGAYRPSLRLRATT
jgi:hypothetical protein